MDMIITKCQNMERYETSILEIILMAVLIIVHQNYFMQGKKGKIFQLHRLVAQAFIPNPENKQYVRHHDGDNLNNEALNLYWQSYDEFREWGDEQARKKRQ